MNCLLDIVSYPSKKRKKTKKQCRTLGLGTAEFVAPNTGSWMTVVLPIYPSSTLLSLNRNQGQTRGAVTLTPNGLILGKVGDPPRSWQLSFQTIMILPTGGPAVVPVFLVLNNGPITNPVTGNTSTLQDGFVVTMDGQGLALDVPGGTTVTLLGTSGIGSPVTVKEIAWLISALII